MVSEFLFYFGTAWLLWVGLTALRTKRREWDLLALFAVLAVFGAAAMVLPPHLPVHEHNSFMLRSDCAFSLECDVDPRGPGWLSPVFHVYGILFSFVPNRLGNTNLVSLALTMVAAGLAYAFVRLLFVHFNRAQAGRVAAFWATALFLFQPIVLRLAVGDTFWPFVLVALWASGIALLVALRTGSAVAVLAAACWFSLATLSNLVFLALLPLPVVAVLAWRRKPSGLPVWAGPAASLLGLSMILPHFVATFRELVLDTHQGASNQETYLNPLKLLYSIVDGNYWLHPSLTPAVGILILVLCVVAVARGYFRMMLPIVFAYLTTGSLLSTLAEVSVEKAYPSGLIHAFSSLQLLAVLGGCGVAWLAESLPRRRVLAHGTLAGLLVLSLLFSVEGWLFVTGETVIGRELVELSRAFEKLPEHDLLVVPSPLQTRLPGTVGGSDPVEVHFPEGQYWYAMSDRGGWYEGVMRLDEYMVAIEAGRGRKGARTLFYLGSPLRTFLNVEIESGVVPDHLERESLVRLRQRFVLEPVLTFEIETRQHRGISARLSADREPTTELGFYWLHKK